MLPIIGLGAGAMVLLIARVAGVRNELAATFVDMGFDPGRGVLIASLAIGAMVAVIVAAVSGSWRSSVALGVLGVVGNDAGSFKSQTIEALKSVGPGGAFDPLGWSLTAVSILVAAVAVCWAAAALTTTIRSWIRSSLVPASVALRSGTGYRRLVPALRLLLVSVLVLGSLPVLADMFNYGTDVHMRVGGPPTIGLFSGPSGEGPAGSGAGGVPGGSGVGGVPTGSLPTSSYPYDLVPGPMAGVLLTPDSISAEAPWTRDTPNGPSRTIDAQLPGPWNGDNPVGIQIYLPPGYDAQPARRYPALYELPYGLTTWEKGMSITATLDQLITSGHLPPMIAVFVSESGGPYIDAECSNSFDQREWFDRFLGQTMVPWVDRTFRTLARSEARTVIGASKGGYCAASALTHHPDLFGNAISFSGYFVAGLQSQQTIGSDLVFGRDPAYESSQSPMNRVQGIPSGLRRNLFVVLEANPADTVYGTQQADFSLSLARAGVPQALISTSLGHSWSAQRQWIPVALMLVAERQVRLGLFL